MSIEKFLSLKYEKKLWRQGFNLVAGADEAGRGALAGPIVAAVVLFDNPQIRKSLWARQVRDSKLLTAKRREQLYYQITKQAIGWSLGVVNNKYIDKFGIQQANIEAVWRAVANLNKQIDYLLVDWIAKFKQSVDKSLLTKSGETPPYLCIVKGDNKVFSIACASIVAKVRRDKLMKAHHKKYPNYGFRRHKGYGTLIHRQAIKKYGPCPLHRRSFKLV